MDARVLQQLVNDLNAEPVGTTRFDFMVIGLIEAIVRYLDERKTD